ncbi:hypothetical protein Tco_0240741 [Tanacetum coccineum]
MVPEVDPDCKGKGYRGIGLWGKVRGELGEYLGGGFGRETVGNGGLSTYQQAAQVLLHLQTTKKKSPTEQYIFQRHTPVPSETAGHEESSSLYAELGLYGSDTESDEEMPSVVRSGAQDEGQAGPDPGKLDEGQAGPNPDDVAESQLYQLLVFSWTQKP